MCVCEYMEKGGISVRWYLFIGQSSVQKTKTTLGILKRLGFRYLQKRKKSLKELAKCNLKGCL